MRVERWYWLIGFCVVSLGLHLMMTRFSPVYDPPKPPEKPQEIEVALQPIPEPEKKPEPKPLPVPKPVVKLTPQPQPTPVAKVVEHRRRETPVRPVSHPTVVVHKAAPVSAPTQPAPIEPNPAHTSAGGLMPVDTEKPEALSVPNTPKVATAAVPHIAPAHREADVGGGAPSPSTIPDGKGGAAGPEAPPEEVLYNGGGKGGKQLPKEAPATGGGGGNSILSVSNPLAKDVIAEDKPGVGPGSGGNTGAGAGGGVGFARGKGIGTNPRGKVAVGSLSNADGSGNGNRRGSGAGTRPPGGGHGTGAELPGTGGEGVGYGRGKGVGIGNGSGASIGDGPGGSVFATRGSPSYGDIAGLLGGGPGGRGGGLGGRGTGTPGSFGTKEQIPFALKGDIYYLDPGTGRLPLDFKRLHSVGSIYTPSLNIPSRQFNQGFPGVTDRFEWFAIDYNGDFRVSAPARYKFRLTSDDGSKLFIDSKLVIDNDGTHGVRMKEGSIHLEPGKHTIEVQYFQGPRFEVALILDVKAEAE